MATTYPVLIPSAAWYAIGPFDGYHYAKVVLYVDATDKEGRVVATCGHRHRLARVAVGCAERRAAAIIRRNRRSRAARARQVGAS